MQDETALFVKIEKGDGMTLEYGFHEFLTEADNIYDLAGNCFGLLCENIQNQQLFTSRYFDQGEGQEFNPNIHVLNRFSEELMRTIMEHEPSEYADVKYRMLELIEKIQLQDHMDPKENQLTVIYCILTAIDSAADTWEKNRVRHTFGPLDRQHKTSYRVYFNMTKTIHQDYVYGVERSRVTSSDFFEQFENFRFINADRWKKSIEVPDIKYLRLSKKWKENNGVIRKLKIAVIPVSNEKNFEFKKIGNNRFVVDYSNHDQKHLAKKIAKTVETAISIGSNIIVLPEYVVSPQIYSSIQQQIKDCRRKLKEEMDLMLVFAGSTWMEDNNIMRILDSWGNEVGKYYKYTPYTKMTNGKPKMRLCEALNSPGKFCDMIAVEDVGLFLPAICRDMIDGDYTEELAQLLLPAFVIIAAWSLSINQFVQRQKELANKYFISTVLANACSARKKRVLRIGNGGIASKKGTIAGTGMEYIKREQCFECCDSKGCFYMLDYDFSYVDKKKNTDIKITRHEAE